MEAEVINYGWLSLIPPIVAVVLAFATRSEERRVGKECRG